MKITRVREDKRKYLPLLLVGDEQESMVDRYLNPGELFVMTDDNSQPVAVAVVLQVDTRIYELKNIAVAESFRHRGYGRLMINHICDYYAGSIDTLLAGTGDVTSTTTFYRQCGFEYSHTVNGFFIKNYDHPIYEDGQLLDDMVYFKKVVK